LSHFFLVVAILCAKLIFVVGIQERICRMSLQSHLAELERRHQALKKEIETELLHPSADKLKLRELKRRKLFLKDEIEKLKQVKEPQPVH